MTTTDLEVKYPFRGSFRPMQERRGGFATVHTAEVKGTLVKEFHHIYDFTTGEKLGHYTFDQFSENVVNVAMTLAAPILGLAPFLPRFAPVWREGNEGGKGFLVSEQVSGQELHYSGPRDDHAAMQLDELIAASLRVPLRVQHPNDDHLIMPDIFYYKDSNPPVEVRMRNVSVGRLATASPESAPGVYLIDVHPAIQRRKDYDPKKYKLMVREGLYNLSTSGYDYPKAHAVLGEHLDFIEEYWS